MVARDPSFDRWATSDSPAPRPRLAVTISSGLLSIAAVVLALPVTWLGRAASAARGRQRPSSWRQDAGGLQRQRRSAGSPRVPGSGRRFARVALVAALVVGAVVVGTQRQRASRTPERALDVAGNPLEVDPKVVGLHPVHVPYSDIPAGRGLDYANDLERDQGKVRLPLAESGGYKVQDLRSRYVNVRDGERVSTAASPCTCPNLEVWLVGGSAAFGTGQRDGHTIASDLVRKAQADRSALGSRVVVRNLGVPGHTLWQGYEKLLARLASSSERPDLVVFYEGFNDFSYTFSDVLLHGADWTVPSVDRTESDGGGLEKLGRTGLTRELRHNGGARALGAREMRRFGDLDALISRQLRGLGVPSQSYFQPDASTSQRQFEAFSRSTALGLTSGVRFVHGEFEAYMDGGMAALPARIHDLRSVLDHEPDALYYDVVHTNEAGAALVSDALYAGLRPALVGLAQGQKP